MTVCARPSKVVKNVEKTLGQWYLFQTYHCYAYKTTMLYKLVFPLQFKTSPVISNSVEISIKVRKCDITLLIITQFVSLVYMWYKNLYYLYWVVVERNKRIEILKWGTVFSTILTKYNNDYWLNTTHNKLATK